LKKKKKKKKGTKINEIIKYVNSKSTLKWMFCILDCYKIMDEYYLIPGGVDIMSTICDPLIVDICLHFFSRVKLMVEVSVR
jgi:hypothetical protein